jgi:hypothetical protein
MLAVEHNREGEVEVWRSEGGGQLRMWTSASVVQSEMAGHLDVALGHAFLSYFEPLLTRGDVLTGLHDWSRMTGYDTEARKLLTRWTGEHRASFRRIVIYTQSRLVRMGIATANLVLGSFVEAVGTREALDLLIAQATQAS